MRQINMETPSRLSSALASVGLRKRESDAKPSTFSKTKMLLGSAFMLSLGLFGSKANAQIAHYTATNGTGTAVTYAANAAGTTLAATGLGSTTACSSGGFSGVTNNGVTTFSTSNGHVYFTVTANPGYVLNVTGYTCKLRRSASGIQKVRMAYTTGTSIINDLIDQGPDNTSCGGGADVFSWNTASGGALPTGVTSFTAELFPYAPVSSGGTVQFNDITINGTVAVNAVSCPSVMATGTVTPSASTLCGSNTVLLTLNGNSIGTAVNYQWQSSPNGTSWSALSGATATSYTTAISTPSVTATTYYRAVSTCTVSGTSATSAAATVVVNPTPNAGAITGSVTLPIGSTTTLTNTTASTGGSLVGVWSSSSTSIATINPTSGLYGGVAAGNTTIGYTVTDVSTGCSASTSVAGGVVFAGTLATYIGTGGTSTTVTGIAGETVSALTKTAGFGSATACTTGGLSGITVPTTVASFSLSNPYISYTVTPTPGNVLNVNGFWVKSRSSGTGPQQGRLAYSIDGGATWTDEGVDHVLATTGSCGANTNVWHWTPAAAINGITNSIIIAVFPYHASSNTGTFQVNTLEVDGVVTSSVACTSAPAAGVITPSVTVVCATGYAALTFAGDAGVGISYVWEQNSGSGFTTIPGASNITYTSPVYSVAPTNITYMMVTTCAGAGSTNSAVSTFSVTPLPDAISGAPSPYLYVGQTTSLGDAVTGGTWSSSHFSVASIDSTSGNLTGIIPGITVITYSTAGFGCSVSDTVTVIDSNTIAVYLGTGGNSTGVTPIASVLASSLTATGFSTASLCSEGGLSGMTVSTTIATYNAGTNPYVGFTIDPMGASITISGIHTTLRSSATGPQLVRIAYSTDGGATWTDNGTDMATDVQSCGVSTLDINWIQTISTSSPIIIAVYPFASISNGGTFQVNSIDVTGPSCSAVGTILDPNSNPLDMETYSGFCPAIQLSCTPAGGTWSSMSSDPVNSVDASGNLSFDMSVSGDVPVTVTYTTGCGVATATATVSDGSGFTCDGNARHAATTGVSAVTATGIQIYPNPASMTLNITAAEKVNVTILSMDGKTLIEQNNATAVNINNLASGLYMIQVYSNKDNTLIKTEKFTKE